MAKALPIRTDWSADELRQRARREKDPRLRVRLLAIANALSGMSRAEAAQAVGLERQALRDAVLRFNADGPEGLRDRWSAGRPCRLSEGQQAALKAEILRGPAPERDGLSAYRVMDICRLVEERYGVRYTDTGMLKLLKRLGLSWQKARPVHPGADAKAQERFKKASRLWSAR